VRATDQMPRNFMVRSSNLAREGEKSIAHSLKIRSQLVHQYTAWRKILRHRARLAPVSC
jgi:hypothetical protein